MKRFAALLDRLFYSPGRDQKLRLLAAYLRATPDPDRGWALAALTDALRFHRIRPKRLRGLIGEKVDPVLFELSHDHVGDLAETSALLWPSTAADTTPNLAEVVARLQRAGRVDAARCLAGLLDVMNPTERWALLKLATGGLRVGVGAGLVRAALAQAFCRSLDEIEEIWHGVAPPYDDLFAWLDNRAPKPDTSGLPVLRPFMAARALDEHQSTDLGHWQVEWKWDGVRVQAVAVKGARRLYDRSGEDISDGFPDITAAMTFSGIIDGVLLAGSPGKPPMPSGELRRRLNRRAVSRKLLSANPVYLCAFDLLFDADKDIRSQPLSERRTRLDALAADTAPEMIAVSDLLHPRDASALAELHAASRAPGRAGLMLKRRDSAYVPGRTGDAWYAWNCDPLTADAVLLYAERGDARRAAGFAAFTVGAWRDGQLVPVGNACAQLIDDDLARLEQWIADHVADRFGPVQQITPDLVVTVAFDAVQRSPRRKSGLFLAGARIIGIQWHQPAEQAVQVATIDKLAG